MSDFKAKIQEIRFPLGLRPKPYWGAYSAPLAVFKGPTSKGREGEGEGKGREEREAEGRIGNGGEGFPQLGSLDPPVHKTTVQRGIAMIFVW